MPSLAAIKTSEAARLLEWTLTLTEGGPVSQFPCHLVRDPDCPARSGVALVEAFVRHSRALARRGIRWELRQLPDWTPGNRLAYVNLVLWKVGQKPPQVGWPLAPGKWVCTYRRWLAEKYGWGRQFTGWKRRVAASAKRNYYR